MEVMSEGEVEVAAVLGGCIYVHGHASILRLIVRCACLQFFMLSPSFDTLSLLLLIIGKDRESQTCNHADAPGFSNAILVTVHVHGDQKKTCGTFRRPTERTG
jgi:hypothetical protein